MNETMDDPDLRSDETILVRTPGIYVKSIPFEGILTNKRIFLIDRAKKLLPPKEILLATIKDVDPGENAIRDQTITLSVIAKTGEVRQMILTFSRQAGGNRIKERNDWVRFLRERTSSSFEQAIRRVVPGRESTAKAEEGPAPRIEVVNSPVQQSSRPALQSSGKKEVENIQPLKRITGANGSHEPIPITKRESAPPAEPVMEEHELPAFGLFCSRCGNRLMEGSVFCNRCGYQVARQATVAESASLTKAGLTDTRPPGSVREDLQYDQTPGEPEMRIAADPIREAIERDDRGLHIPSSPAATGVPKKPPRATFFSRIFGKREKSLPLPKKSQPAGGALPPRKVPDSGRGSRFRPGRRTILAVTAILVLVVVVVLGVMFVLPMVSSGSGFFSGTSSSPATSSSGSSSPTINPTIAPSGTFVPVETTPATIPAAGVYVHINYLGSWQGTYGMPSDPQKTVDSGDRLYEVLNATGTVQASVTKRDSSTRHDLTLEIYKDGKLLTSGATSAAFGSVTLSVDVKTGIVQPPKISAGTTPAAATPSLAGTTVPTTSKTNGPAVNTTTAAH